MESTSFFYPPEDRTIIIPHFKAYSKQSSSFTTHHTSITNAIIRTQFSYALIFWTPTQHQYQQILSRYITPLRRSLGLAQHTGIRSILHEYNLPTPQLFRQYNILQFFHRIYNLPNSYPSFQLFSQLRPPRQYLKRTPPLLIELHSIQQQWNINFNDDTKDIDSSFHRQCIPSSSLVAKYRGLEDFKAIPSFYLTILDKPDVCNLARLRFNSTRLNYRLRQYKLVDEPFCSNPICYQLQLHETPQHILIQCPIYLLPRMHCLYLLRQHGYPSDLNMLLGDVSSIPNQQDRTEAIRIINNFIKTAYKMRHF